MCDSKGVISTSRTDLNAMKRTFATDRDVHTLAEALVAPTSSWAFPYATS